MKKIMFNDKYGLTQFVLEGGKTQTRRMLNPTMFFQKLETYEGWPNEDIRAWKRSCNRRLYEAQGDTLQQMLDYALSSSRYKLGEVVAVAQKYKDIALDIPVELAAELIKQPGWNNKMFVKADLMPHRIRITNIRIERLQDISDEDVIHEGFSNICFNKNKGNMLSEWCYDLCYYDAFGNSQSLHSTIAKEAYSYLIAKLYGWSLWDSNPYVFVYDFELVKKELDG